MDQQSSASVHSIDHFAVHLGDLAEALRFVTAFGLDAHEEGGELKVRTSGDSHVWARLLGGRPKSLAYVSFGAAAQDVDRLRSRALAAGASLATPPRDAGTEGFWISDPDGNRVQVKEAACTQPNREAHANANTASRVASVAGRSRTPRVKPTRLSHILLFTADVERMIDFYHRALGLNLSDRSGDVVAFLHAPHGCDHHLLAFAKSATKGFHHSSWDVPGVDSVGLGAMQMREAGYDEHWGVGRHVLGSNYFDYVRDRAGAWWEFSSQIDYIPSGANWRAGNHPAEDSFYLWGPEVPPTFVENAETGASTS